MKRYTEVAVSEKTINSVTCDVCKGCICLGDDKSIYSEITEPYGNMTFDVCQDCFDKYIMKALANGEQKEAKK